MGTTQSNIVEDTNIHFQKCDSCYLWNYRRGLHYGYPVCCIESFSSKLSGIPFNDTHLEVSKYNFIPCRNHSILIKENKIKIEDLIGLTRKEIKPFSNDTYKKLI